MLGKLFKHEFKDTAKILLPLNLALIGVTIIGMIILGLKVFDFEGVAMGFLAASMVFFYVLAIIALFIVTYIYLMIRFYRTMYSDEGYLTHTLPVSTFSVFNVKLLVSVFWAFLTMILAVISVIALFCTVLQSAGELTSSEWNYVLYELEMFFDKSVPALIGKCLLYMLVSCLSGLLMIYCSISIGQLFNKYKVAASIVTYIIIYIVLQIVNLILNMHRSMQIMTNSLSYAYQSTYDDVSIIGDIFASSMIQSVVLIVIYYITCVYISNKKLNLT